MSTAPSCCRRYAASSRPTTRGPSAPSTRTGVTSPALAEHQQGNRAEALRWFERNRAACGPPGLFTEEYDVSQRQLRGNLPQAFVHALMLETATRLA